MMLIFDHVIGIGKWMFVTDVWCTWLSDNKGWCGKTGGFFVLITKAADRLGTKDALEICLPLSKIDFNECIADLSMAKHSHFLQMLGCI